MTLALQEQQFALTSQGLNQIQGPNIASATTIAPTHGIHIVTGTTAIVNITIPSADFSGSIILQAAAIWTWTAAGNITVAGTVTAAGGTVVFTYIPSLAKWAPSRVDQLNRGRVVGSPFIKSIMEQPQKTEINKINKYLLDHFHTSGPSRKPKYKVVWSEDCFEWRYAEVAKYDEHGNFLCYEVGTQFLKKWNWVNNRYILVMHVDGPAEQGDIANHDGYEALFVFDNHGEHLPPTIFSIEYMLNALHNIAPATKQDHMAEQAIKDIEEERLNLNELTEAGKLFEGETVGYTGKEFQN